MKKRWPACGREAHLLGGAVAINKPRERIVSIWPASLDGKKVKILLPTYERFYLDIHRFGCQIVGVDFFTHADEVVGASPPQWRSYAKQSKDIWIHWTTLQKWGQIVSHSTEKKNGVLYDMANRIRYQLESVSERLRLLSCSYRDQLKARVITRDFRPEWRFEDGYTKKIYQSFHAFLFDACILRDYLAEFIYNFSESGHRKKNGLEIATAASLIKKILRKLKSPNVIEKEFIDITNENGWVFKLGAYRDLIMHAAPLAIAHNKLWAICGTVDLPGNNKLPIVRCPIPEDPSLILKIRTDRNKFNEYLKRFEDFSKASTAEIPSFDCLDYSHDITERLSCLSLKVMELSPLPPREIIFTESDIIDLKIMKRGYTNLSS
jgi:hypothetical protein